MMAMDLDAISAKLESSSSRDRLLALASLRDVEAAAAVPLIKKVLNDENLQVRSMAVFALGLKPTTENYEILVELVETDPDYGIRSAAAGALGYLEDQRAVGVLVRALYEDTDWLVRFSAAASLGNLKDPRATKVLIEALDSPEVVIQQAAIAALGEIQATDALPHILRFADAEDWLVRQRLAESLGNFSDQKAISALKYLEKDSHPQVAAAATFGLQNLAQAGYQV
ncbi:MAG TPA: HEAT repeat domain-containing protein [Oscillatoriaceae cyanobacterium M33_DOE_052]|uniref:HEAT repeat domain-containing protein n=1 Tax=Planktothricoides sp. SpSt-374 TaxID=2282167 RepID=A0A7C3ZQT3_9CYAN|nr:HEAT repeat domain-containing protein [Oscillatoriaceae cyanobacterium M33_DOE_052]